MPVKVSFMRPAFVGSISTLVQGACRLSETVTVPGTTAASAQDGEFIVLFSTESVGVVAAHGSTPDAAATVATALTSAGYGVGPLVDKPVQAQTGDKVNIKVFV